MQRRLVVFVLVFMLGAVGTTALFTISGDGDGQEQEDYAAWESVAQPEVLAAWTLPLSSAEIETGGIVEAGGIYWRVIAFGEGRALVVSEYILENRFFHDAGGAVKWEDSSIRQYLNGEFLERFSAEERAHIIEARIANDRSIWSDGVGISPSTFDHVFLLSMPELLWHLGDIAAWPGGSMDFSDQYNAARRAYTLDGTPDVWWLRSPGAQGSNTAAFVMANGVVMMGGGAVGGISLGVRPAMWLRLDGHEEQRYAFDVWNPDNFSELRQPAVLTDNTRHGQIALKHIEFMNDNLHGRGPFTVREKEAAVWIVEELLAMGHSWENIEVQEFYGYQPIVLDGTWWHWTTRMKMWGAGDFASRDYSQNVILTIPGQSERKIIVGAHYDSPGNAGASDNAGGVGLLLESAQRMLGVDNYHTIVYIFFGAEELALTGAVVYYNLLSQEARENIVMMINADVLFEGEHFVFGAGYNLDMAGIFDWPATGAHQNDVTRRVNAIADEIREAHGLQIASNPGVIAMGSDQRVFLQAGHTVVQFYGADLVHLSDYGGNARWHYGEYVLTGRILHSPRDCFHYINENWPGKMEGAMRTFSLLLDGLLRAEY